MLASSADGRGLPAPAVGDGQVVGGVQEAGEVEPWPLPCLGPNQKIKAEDGRTLFVRTLNLRVAQVFLFSLCPASANNTDIFQVRKYS